MKKRLVFFVYVDCAYRDCLIYDIHFANLSKYYKIFDAATIYFSLKEINEDNMDIVRYLAKKIIDCGFINDVEIKIRKNTEIREVDCFKEEVISRIENNVPELVFFTHTKGISNVLNESLFKWICGMYYFNLNFIDEVNCFLVSKPIYDTAHRSGIFYGFPCLVSNIKNYITSQVFYPGTIYWVNCSKAAQYNRYFEIEPKNKYIYSTRCFAEEFPGDYFMGVVCQSHFMQNKEEFSLYEDFDKQMESIYSNNSYADKEGFDSYCNEIKDIVSLYF